MTVAPSRIGVNAASPPIASGDGFLLLITYLRETNAEALRIRERLAALIDPVAAGTPAASTAPFVQIRDVIDDEVRNAQARSASIQPLRQSDADDFARYARELVQVDNAWNDLSEIWSPLINPVPPVADLITSAKQSIDILDKLAFLCALQTIPNELDNYLQNYRIGQKLDFVATFKDQLPTDQATREVLADLAPQSAVICGLVDLANGFIIKASESVRRQVLSVVFILVAVLLGFGLIGIGAHAGVWLGFQPGEWPIDPKQWKTLNSAYVLVLLGVLGHWVLDRIKLDRAGTDLLPLAEWLLWLHVNEVQIIFRIATVWMLIALAVAFKLFALDKGVQPVTYFTAGYFIDSTFDALLGRFNTFIGDKDPAKKQDAA
jgi:hypothetical protein